MHDYSIGRVALILGLLQAVGPFAIDMYLPGMPSMGHELQASATGVQLTLMAFFVALGFGQLFYGPLSDMLGRKRPLIAGLALFGLASIGCALAQDIETLILLRFIQGLGACAASVIPRAVVRDLYTGHEATRMMGLLMLVFSVSPILAPLAGSLLIDLAGWRSVFWAITGVAAIGGLLSTLGLKETRPREQRTQSSWSSAFSGYALLLRDRHFLAMVLIGGLGMAGFMVYLANASFVLINHYGLSARQFSLAFALNAAAFIGAAQFGPWLSRRFGMARLMRASLSGFALSMLGAALSCWGGLPPLATLIGLLFVGYGCLGLTLPGVSVLAMDRHGAIAGTAAALMGSLHFAVGALAMLLVGWLGSGQPLAMLLGIAGCALASWALGMAVLKGQRQAALTDV